MKQDAMIEALKRNKANALNITITLDAPDGVSLNTGGQADADPTEGLMDDSVATPGGDGSMENAEQDRRELDLAPDAEPLEGNSEAQVQDNEGLGGLNIEDELAKGNFGKSSMVARKKGLPMAKA